MEVREVLRQIEERVAIIEQLREATERQLEAVRAGRMSELMQILSLKHEPIRRLHDLSRELRLALELNGSSLRWSSDAQRDQCRQRHQASEAMLAELLQSESECEQLLSIQRQAVGDQLLNVGRSQRAATGYARTAEQTTVGQSLDLSSEN